MILFIMINNTPDNNHDNSYNEIMRIFFLDTKALKKHYYLPESPESLLFNR